MKIPYIKKIFKKEKYKLPKKLFEEKTIGIRDIIAPSSIEITSNFLKLGEKLSKTFFIFSYPRYLNTSWFSPVINLNTPMDISLFVHPIETELTLKQLRKKVTEVQAELMEREEKGLIRDPTLETAFQDMEDLRDKLQTAQERMFRFGLYITIYGNDQKELKDTEVTLRQILESRLIYIKPALYQQKQGFISCSPYGLDQLDVYTLMNTGSLSSIFPFASFDLSSNEGILYGINRHNNSLILFDRFSMENANMILFAKSGSGKSYAVKLEILRSLMLGVDCIVVDPENEYEFLSDAVDGSYFDISLSSESHINPFDLPAPGEGENPEDILRENIINLVGLLRLMLGGLSPEEDALIDQALTETYKAKDITAESDFSQIDPPLMSDFETILDNMEGTESLVKRVKKFTEGTYSSFFNQPSNVTMKNKLVIFGIRDMEEGLRPIAMFIILRYIWKTIRSEMKKRILVIDEAWLIMKNEDGASFLYGIAKRARKYWLGVTTITQDVNDFMNSSYGQPIVTNSSIQLLMKQSPASIDLVKDTFNLTDEEKYLLLEAAVGEGIFFAGQKHVALKIVASYAEDQIITTSPEQVLKIKQAKKKLENI